MIRLLFALALPVTLFAGPVLADDPVEPAGEKTYELPADGKTPVIQMDYKGGFTPPRKKADPALTILADGTVLCPDRFGAARDVTGRIDPEEVRELLRFVLGERKFGKVDAAAIKKAVADEQRANNGFLPVVADAPNTWVKVTTKGTTHEAEYYALGMAARQHPKIDALQDFDAIAKRLQRVMHVAHGGGRERIAEILKVANAELKRQHPEADPLEMEHLTSAYVRADGSTTYNFGWSAQGMPGVPATRTFVNASVAVPENGEPTVTVRAKI